MALKKLSALCEVCPNKDTCDHKRMECVGQLEMPNIATAVSIGAPDMEEIREIVLKEIAKAAQVPMYMLLG